MSEDVDSGVKLAGFDSEIEVFTHPVIRFFLTILSLVLCPWDRPLRLFGSFVQVEVVVDGITSWDNRWLLAVDRPSGETVTA